ncbi:Clavaminate synthase-like protein [Favolaschia claudopus]|uniref:Clavaminate synthase-like protein n=1 Tax=Favolaschia claudopus TaxID=2862362 RepID=A0AAW0E7T8_9AGAR
MASPAVTHSKQLSMPIDRLLNAPSPSPPRVQPHNSRQLPPLPEVRPVYASVHSTEPGYTLSPMHDPWRRSSSYTYPGSLRSSPTNTYPPNPNTRLIIPNPPSVNSWVHATRSPYDEDSLGASRRRSDPIVSPSGASIYSERQTDRHRPSRSLSYEPSSIPPTGSYHAEVQRRDFENGRSSYQLQHTSYERQESPGIDPSQFQRGDRASLRLVARGNSRENSPAYDYYHQEFSQQRKRDALQVEDAEEPPRKRNSIAKSREHKTASTGTKRGGNTAKKRSEPVAAHSGQLPNAMYTVEKSGGNRDDSPHRVVPVKISRDTNLFCEEQTSRCMSTRYKSDEYPKCIACTRRWAGDTCRFQNLRSFYRDNKGTLVGMSFLEKENGKIPNMEYPDKWNIPLGKNHISLTKEIIAAALLPTLREELHHVNLPLVIYRPRESEVRATCDTCLTSIFCCSWMCRTCGREACPECFDRVRTLTVDVGSPSQVAELQDRRDELMHENPFFLNCLKRKEHGAKDFSPITRFSKPELSEAIRQMEELLQDEGIPIPEQSIPGSSSESVLAVLRASSQIPSPKIAASPSNDSEATLAVNGHSSGQSMSPSVSGLVFDDVPSHEISRFAESELTIDVFRSLWARGDPLLVTDAGKKLKINWSPEYFIEKYGEQPVVLIECQTDENMRTTVGEFFKGFGKYHDRTKCWKLKDWPPEKDFKAGFPELYTDFNEAVPVQDYVRRDGALNIASHFPSNSVSPDLGPKMYNANANRESDGCKGSTRLHMDMADALNLMTYAAPDEHGKEGCAAWDLFRAQDSDTIRRFMRDKYAQKGVDPIHLQQVYLDDDARRELWQQYGVKSYRVYQKAGEAVFIPAGCAHQVRNLSDCIKVAIDFVSPENIERCAQLTREFRSVNQAKAWKEDVLQLRSMMWFAWLSCCRQEDLARV